jgi:hypothetical protein
MGLDMYLTKHTYVKQWDSQPIDKRHSVAVKRGDTTVASIKPQRVTYVVEEVAYWRKANAIHRWFVDNVADGVDDCRDVEVSREQLQELLDLVTTVLASSTLKHATITNGYRITSAGEEPIMEEGQAVADPHVAMELLPTQSGFFFGSTDYDQYYIEDLRSTKDVLTEILNEPEADDLPYHFEYHASW